MSLSVRRRVLRSALSEEDVFVMGERVRETLPTTGAFATAAEILSAAEVAGERSVTAARSEAAELLRCARAEEEDFRRAAYAEGFEAGRAEALAAVSDVLDQLRRAAAEGKAIRDRIAEQSGVVVARAVVLATRRIVGEYYGAGAERTAAICAEVLRSAAGQDILALRVNPEAAGAVAATLGEAARYVRPDSGIDVGGCVIDLAHGTIDATLDARLSLMELALTRAGGGEA